jgi:nucleotide-binding universal stress UspA family protein
MSTDEKTAGERSDSWIKHLVVALDASPASMEGLEIAIDAARRTGARVSVVHIRHAPVGTNFEPALEWGPMEETLDALEAEVRAATKHAMSGTGIDWEFRTVVGSPGEEIVKVAKEVGADMVVVGSSGHSSLHNLLLGSTSAYLASHSPTAVLVARASSSRGSTAVRQAGSPAAAIGASR